MPFIPTPNCIQVDVVQTFQGQRALNVFHYVKASPWNLVTMEEFATEFLAEWVANILGQQTSSLSFDALRIVNLASETGEVLDYSTGLPLPGGQAGSPALPNNVACVFTKRTQLRGRSYRGRTFHMGFTEAQITGNTVSSGTASDLVDAYTELIAIDLPIALDEAIMVVLSLQNNNVPRSEGVATPVFNITTDAVVDSQRRRLPGRGA